MRKRLIIVFLFLLITGITVSCTPDSGYPITEQRQGPIDARFLRVYGAVNYAPNTPGASNGLSLALVTRGTDDFTEGPIEIVFDHPLVIAEESSIEKTLTYGGYTLWQLSCNISVPMDQTSEKDIAVHQVMIGGTAYELGTLFVQLVEEVCSYDYPLCLLAHASASNGLNLSSYTATLQNRALGDEMIIMSVDLPGYEQAIPYVIVGNVSPDVAIPATAELENETMYHLLNENAPVKNDQVAELVINMEDCTIEHIQVYYVSPVIHYRYQGEDFQMPLYYYVAGLVMTNDEFLDIARSLPW